MAFAYDHLHLRSPNPELAAALYADWFEATITSRTPPGAAVRVTVELGGLRLLIEQVRPGTAALPRSLPVVGIEHIALRVDDLDEVAAQLRTKGVQFLVEPRLPRPGVKIAFLDGPDGVLIEIVERTEREVTTTR